MRGQRERALVQESGVAEEEAHRRVGGDHNRVLLLRHHRHEARGKDALSILMDRNTPIGKAQGAAYRAGGRRKHKLHRGHCLLASRAGCHASARRLIGCKDAPRASCLLPQSAGGVVKGKAGVQASPGWASFACVSQPQKNPQTSFCFGANSKSPPWTLKTTTERHGRCAPAASEGSSKTSPSPSNIRRSALSGSS